MKKRSKATDTSAADLAAEVQAATVALAAVLRGRLPEDLEAGTERLRAATLRLRSARERHAAAR